MASLYNPYQGLGGMAQASDYDRLRQMYEDHDHRAMANQVPMPVEKPAEKPLHLNPKLLLTKGMK